LLSTTGVSVKRCISDFYLQSVGNCSSRNARKSGRRNEYLTFRGRKRTAGTPFFELGKKGELTTVAQIKASI